MPRKPKGPIPDPYEKYPLEDYPYIEIHDWEVHQPTTGKSWHRVLNNAFLNRKYRALNFAERGLLHGLWQIRAETGLNPPRAPSEVVGILGVARSKHVVSHMKRLEWMGFWVPRARVRTEERRREEKRRETPLTPLTENKTPKQPNLCLVPSQDQPKKPTPKPRRPNAISTQAKSDAVELIEAYEATIKPPARAPERTYRMLGERLTLDPGLKPLYEFALQKYADCKADNRKLRIQPYNWFGQNHRATEHFPRDGKVGDPMDPEEQRAFDRSVQMVLDGFATADDLSGPKKVAILARVEELRGAAG